METNKNERTFQPVSGRIVSEKTLGIEDFPLAEENQDNEKENIIHPNFIESNTQAITLDELENKCVVPTFSDTSLTISHQNFIFAVKTAAEKVFGELTGVEIRVSHPVNGRTPNALFKRKEDLLPEDTTLFYQRMAWICKVKSISRECNGQTVYLTIGGVRAYNEDKLYNRKSAEKFRIFVGWQVRVCSNLMLTCDGSSGIIDCMSESDIFQKAHELFSNFNMKKDSELRTLEELNHTRVSEQQFVNIIGRLRLYEAMDASQKKNLPTVLFGDQAANSAVRGYLENPNFSKKEGEESITCWQLMQLFNEAIKSSYIDKWLERNQNCTDFAIGISKYLNGDSAASCFGWFLK